jgi:hypothetical protein
MTSQRATLARTAAFDPVFFIAQFIVQLKANVRDLNRGTNGCTLIHKAMRGYALFPQ